MPYPQEYQIATQKFQEFLADVKSIAGFGSSHMAFTMTQGVFQVFRRRLSLEQAVQFASILPVGLRALFLADWNFKEQQKSFGDRKEMLKEVTQLRSTHNFSNETKDSIYDVASALRKHIDEKVLDGLLKSFPNGPFEFWSIGQGQVEC